MSDSGTGSQEMFNIPKYNYAMGYPLQPGYTMHGHNFNPYVPYGFNPNSGPHTGSHHIQGYFHHQIPNTGVLNGQRYLSHTGQQVPSTSEVIEPALESGLTSQLVLDNSIATSFATQYVVPNEDGRSRPAKELNEQSDVIMSHSQPAKTQKLPTEKKTVSSQL